MDKSIFFIICAVGCIYLILDNFYGNKLIDKFISKLTSNDTDTEVVMTDNEKESQMKYSVGMQGDAEKAGEESKTLWDELTPEERILVYGE